MKTFLVIMLLMALKASAGETALINCAPRADILNDVIVFKAADGKLGLRIRFASNKDRTYDVMMVNGSFTSGTDAGSLIATRGAPSGIPELFTEAALLAVDNGQKTASLAFEGNVYRLTCAKRD